MNAPSRPVAHARRHRTRLLALGLFGALLGVSASAAPPVAPHAIAGLPGDDGVILEGYGASPVAVSVFRGSVRIATAGPFLPGPDGVEINHLGSPACWNGFTPDLVYGDEVRVTQAGVTEESRIRNVAIVETADTGPTTFEVRGTAQDFAGNQLPVGELEVRVISSGFQGIYNGGPFILAGQPGLTKSGPGGSVTGTIEYDSTTVTNPEWTATFVFSGPQAAVAQDIAVAAEPEAGWASAALTEITETGLGAPGGPVADCAGRTAAPYGATQASPNVVAPTTTTLSVSGAARADATTVSVTVGDGVTTLGPFATGPGLSTPGGSVQSGGQIWTIDVPATGPGSLALLADGPLTITPTFTGTTPSPLAGTSYTVIKDTVAPFTDPNVTITDGPAEGSLTGSDTATFAFTSAANDVTFGCSLNGGAFTPCPPPHTVGPLPSGQYTLQVRAVDGPTSGPIATRSWTVDVTPPDTTITGGPSGNISIPTATFTFTSPDLTATFDCRLDTGAYAPCTSPVTFNAIPVGAHTVFVRAKDAVGNQDPSPATQGFTVLGAPNTTLVAAPPATTTLTTATFGFTSDGPGATFECSLDGAAFSFCASPVNLSGLTIGSHTFRVRAVDTIGTADPTPAAHAWTVTLPDTERPDVRATIDPLGKLTIGRNGRLTVRGRCDERCTLFARATVSVPKLRGGKPTLYTLQSRTVDSAANTTSSVTLRLTGRQLAVVRNALKAGKSVRITITVVGRDSSGNRGSALRTIFLTKKNL